MDIEKLESGLPKEEKIVRDINIPDIVSDIKRYVDMLKKDSQEIRSKMSSVDEYEYLMQLKAVQGTDKKVPRFKRAIVKKDIDAMKIGLAFCLAQLSLGKKTELENLLGPKIYPTVEDDIVEYGTQLTKKGLIDNQGRVVPKGNTGINKSGIYESAYKLADKLIKLIDGK